MLLSDIGQEGIVVGDYNLGMVCYSLTLGRRYRRWRLQPWHGVLLSDIGQEGIVVGEYNLGMVCYSLTLDRKVSSLEITTLAWCATL